MTGPEEGPQTTTAWEVHVLASCARLAQFPQVHLAPKFPPARLTLAMRAPLPLMENELLVALIDNDSGGFQSEIILTTARLYWSRRESNAAGNGDGSKRAVQIRAYGLDYAMVAPEVHVMTSREKPAHIALGFGQELPLEGRRTELAEALASYLRSVGDAAR